MISEKGLSLVRQFEGLRTTAYKCSAGVWTIGYGHTQQVKAGQVITKPQADALLMAIACSAGWMVYFVLWLIAGFK